MPFDLPWKAWLDWLLPCYCCSCAKQSVQPNKPLCYQCLAELNTTQYGSSDQLRLEKLFWGRIRLESVYALFPLKPHAVLQYTLHQLKYHHRPSIGAYLGALAGKKMTTMQGLADVAAFIPLPLHPSKKRKRGYNQAEKICAGLSAASGIPVWNDILIRNQFTQTQTRKDRGERWANMSGKFSLLEFEKAIGKHLMLVDDVITTGATLEACG
ncbi:MAG: ComF family protein [Bacteroidetes bacterium]|nr:ComF family protein [Bacteroidota bacterium]